jgi:hypothetical protein
VGEATNLRSAFAAAEYCPCFKDDEDVGVSGTLLLVLGETGAVTPITKGCVERHIKFRRGS